ncbi:Clavaminate synthase-like protein [Periconia macrospinosa]|uniref:Clavaminate synthase-like protein n=1 Tax=Periconia macrospinosa TaxID=97972 RepID=A0A2V1E5V0_9PLEO|nr:Clavaminate synthase-like protein [Periconia macrospinosa]
MHSIHKYTFTLQHNTPILNDKKKEGLRMPSTPSLPIIDISPFRITPTNSTFTPSQIQTAHQINSACTTHGFFYLTHHGIPDSKLAQVLTLAREFFALPLEDKLKISRHDAGGPEGGDGARGYQAIGENVTGGRRDMHEAVDWYREWDDVATREKEDKGKRTCEPLKGTNLWPEEPSDLKGVYEEYVEEVLKVGEAVVRAMGAALALSVNGKENDEAVDSEVFVKSTDKSFWVMRMIGYPKLETSSPASSSSANSAVDSLSDAEMSCGEHTDYGCVTLLLADPTPGALQVLHKDGTTWLNADPIPGAFVVNIGDMMERWTNGLWKSTKHRVIHRGDGFRVSVPFFYEPNFDAIIKPLEACVKRSGKDPIHEGSTYGEHLLGKVLNNFY